MGRVPTGSGDGQQGLCPRHLNPGIWGSGLRGGWQVPALWGGAALKASASWRELARASCVLSHTRSPTGFVKGEDRFFVPPPFSCTCSWLYTLA